MKYRRRNLFYRRVRGINEWDARVPEQVLRLLHLVVDLVLGGVAAVGPALLADLLQARGVDGEAVELGTEGQQGIRQTAPVQIVLRQGIVGGGDAVLQGQVQAGGGLAGARPPDQHHVRLRIVAGGDAVVVRQGEVHRLDARE